ncbi:MAG: M20/M25/M40 family metallo-hydrolase [Planctomycetes bacterium]|nr:M20/M25/M40 family metallo-hydrolase [Planctomycetota bacterium]
MRFSFLPRPQLSLPPWLALPLALAACGAPSARPEPASEPVSAVPAPPAAPQGLAGGSGRAVVPDAAAGERAAEEARVVEQVIALGRTDSRAEQFLRHLCLEIGPRLTSSHNLATAELWALEQFESMGLQANLERWGEFPVGFDRGAFRGGIVGDPTVNFEFTTMAWTPGTAGPVRGRALLRPETEEQLEQVQDLLAGAWLLPRTYPRGTERPKVDTALREKIQSAIAAAGIAGEVRSTGRPLVITDGNFQIKWDKLPKNVRISLRGDQHADVVARIERGESVELEFDIDNRFYEGPVPQHNVIADIRGSEWPDEYVIVGGHLDSWDGAQGAVDNATGCATTLEAARLLMASGARPKRTIRFALWTGEEQGLFGSEGYVRDHADELERISAVFIHDGGTNYLSGLGITYDMEEQLRVVCAPIFDLDPAYPFRLRVSDGFNYSPDSDHAPFAGKGVPGFFWDQSGKSDYDHMHHTQYDTFETAVAEYQQHSAMVVALAAFNTANLPGLLSRENFEPIPPRRMGVTLDGTRLASVSNDGKAAKAGWKVDDVVVSVDGAAVASREDVTQALQSGGPRKLVVLRRGTETLETVLDYSGGKDELERQRRASLREAAKAERGLAERKKFW